MDVVPQREQGGAEFNKGSNYKNQGREGKGALCKPFMVLLLGLWDLIPILPEKLRLGALALAVGN